MYPVIKKVMSVVGLALLASVAPAEDGAALYATCVACHGAQGAGNPALSAPALAGQDAAYIQRQLMNYRQGRRAADPADALGQQMKGMASILPSDQAVATVAAYIAGMPAPTGGTLVKFNQRNGENQYNAACGACHGGQAQGNPALNSPRLAGQDPAYLKRQYQNFAAGLRGYHAADTYGRQMKMMSSMLATEQDLDDVIGYIVSQ